MDWLQWDREAGDTGYSGREMVNVLVIVGQSGTYRNLAQSHDKAAYIMVECLQTGRPSPAAG